MKVAQVEKEFKVGQGQNALNRIASFVEENFIKSFGMLCTLTLFILQLIGHCFNLHAYLRSFVVACMRYSNLLGSYTLYFLSSVEDHAIWMFFVRSLTSDL